MLDEPTARFQFLIDLVSGLQSINWLAKIPEKLLQTTNGALMSLNLALPAMTDGIFHEFSLSFTPSPQAGGVLR